tara:strand:+ start:307 stop:687 length:381 start_codon:yes stop_codon:yes gene_type:complete
MSNDSQVKSSQVKSQVPVVFTDKAAQRVLLLIKEAENPNLKFRAYITGGGCSGFQYGFTFDEVQNDDDIMVENGDAILLIDSMSFQYLVGAEIDYVTDVDGEYFLINNPNAKTTCGCGSSFSIDEK